MFIIRKRLFEYKKSISKNILIISRSCLWGDIIHGHSTIFPIPLAQGCSFDPDVVYEICKNTARESCVSGVQVTFSPMVDLVRDARWGRVNIH